MIRHVVWIVFGVHLFLILMLTVHHLFWNEKPKTKIVVRTIPQSSVMISQLDAKPKTGAVVQKKQAPVPQVKTKPPVNKTKSIPSVNKTKPAESKRVEPVKAKSEDLPIPVLKQVPNVTTEQRGDPTPNYGQILIAYLQESLDLPEFGEVKVDLEIDRNGHLVHFEILEEKSKKNGEFLKKRLPELVLPCFNGSMNETVVFTITFKNSTSAIR